MSTMMSDSRWMILIIGLGLCAATGCGLQAPILNGGDLVAVAAESDAAAPADPDGESIEESDPTPVQPPPEGSHEAPEPLPFGTWLLEGGATLTTFIDQADVTAMILNEDGTGRVFLTDRFTGARDCVQAFNVYDGQTLVVDFTADPNITFGINRFFTFPVVAVDHGALGLADESGEVAWFSRQSQLPDDVTCGELEIQRTFTNLPAPQFFSDMVHFNGDLVYSTSTNIERFDLNTNRMGVPLGPTSGRLVQTVQGDHFWTHCGCGGSRDAFRRNLTNIFDTVSSESEMGGATTMRALAYNSVEDLLWIHGRPFDSQFGQFFLVDTRSEPDVVVETLSFNRDLRALAFDGTDMWGIVQIASQTVVRINTITGEVFESYEIPDEDVTWSGLSIDPFSMYLLGTDASGAGVIAKVKTPR